MTHKAKHGPVSWIVCHLGGLIFVLGSLLRNGGTLLSRLAHRWDPVYCEICETELTDETRGAGRPPHSLGSMAHDPAVRNLYSRTCRNCDARTTGRIEAGDIVYSCGTCRSVGMFDHDSSVMRAMREQGVPPPPSGSGALRVPVCPACSPIGRAIFGPPDPDGPQMDESQLALRFGGEGAGPPPDGVAAEPTASPDDKPGED